MAEIETLIVKRRLHSADTWQQVGVWPRRFQTARFFILCQVKIILPDLYRSFFGI
jgi:transposase